MLRPIARYGESVLHQHAAPVESITPEIQSLIDDMIETMYAAPGVGLAAPQIGVGLRIFVVDLSVGRDPNGLITMINPVFVERDGMQLGLQRDGRAPAACGRPWTRPERSGAHAGGHRAPRARVSA